MSKATSHREIEFKFRVPADSAIDVGAIVSSLAAYFTKESPREMVAIYYDTPHLSLLRWGITMRNRRGGGDDGWHLKIPAGTSGNAPVRDELHLDATAGQVPVEFVSLVTPLLRRQELRAMATVNTTRQPFLITAEDGTELLEVVDDHVTVDTDSSTGPAVSFHEVEVELLRDEKRSHKIAASVSQALLAAGAKASSMSKAAQALGPAAADPPDVPALPFPKAQQPAVDALKAVFSTYVRDLLLADVGVRRGLPDAVHQMRVACRRLRSSLKTFSVLLDSSSVDYLRDELRWLASELGEVRDTEVQLARLTKLSDDPAVIEYITSTLEARLRAATSSALAALRSDRHDYLVEDLVLLVSEPPITPLAFQPAAETLPECVREPWRRLRKVVRRASADGPATQWHDVRIRAKQARYAAEAVAPVLGKDFRRLSTVLAKATDILGQRQDAHVASIVLRDLAKGAPPSIAYELGLLTAHNEMAGNHDIRSFVANWPDIVHRAHRAGLE